MTRPIVLSNGSMHVGVNLYGMVHDFYYPYVGLENHATANNMRWRIGVWIAGRFSWLDDGNWEITSDYEDRAMVSNVTARHQNMGVILEFQECVDIDYNVYLRNLHIVNETAQTREIKLFLHQVMRISNSLNGDTVQYLPREQAIMHYKGNRTFLFGAMTADGKTFDQYSVGVYGIEGKEGTFRDAEDGILAGNNVEHGSVDSVVGFTLTLEALSSQRIYYWVAAGSNYTDAYQVFSTIKAVGVPGRIAKTAQYWQEWLRPAIDFTNHINPILQTPFLKSVMIIKSHIDKHGALIASTDTTMRNYSRDAYAYCWPRDGALSLWPLLRLGYTEEVVQFFHFCQKALQPEGYLMHKYQADGALGSSWHPYKVGDRIVPPIQEDETAIVIFLLGQYYHITNDKKVVEALYDGLLFPSAEFMASYIDESTKLPHASYDLWERRFLTTTYTTAVVFAALTAAANLAEVLNKQTDAVRWQTVADDIQHAAKELLFNKERHYFYKGFTTRVAKDGKADFAYEDTIDVSSFYGAFMFGLWAPDDPIIKKALNTLKQTFHISDEHVTPLPRFEHDEYNNLDPRHNIGNPWFITTLWLAQYYLEAGDSSKAQQIIAWVCDHMLQSGVLSEQLDPQTSRFISVAPLAWSQAEFINTIIDTVTNPLAARSETS